MTTLPSKPLRTAPRTTAVHAYILFELAKSKTGVVLHLRMHNFNGMSLMLKNCMSWVFGVRWRW
jgi:hypothetical protein